MQKYSEELGEKKEKFKILETASLLPLQTTVNINVHMSKSRKKKSLQRIEKNAEVTCDLCFFQSTLDLPLVYMSKAVLEKFLPEIQHTPNCAVTLIMIPNRP